MRIKKTIFPENSVLNTVDKEYDYVDSFQGLLNDENNKISSVDIGKAFFSSGPKWIGIMFTLRNKIVSLFGLKTPDKKKNNQEILENFKCEPNERIGLFKVFNKTKNEVVLGENDKHLDFRISLLKKPYKSEKGKNELIITTTVQYNNWIGKLYFLPVKPFHKLIVPVMLKTIIKELEYK